jgi:hypothetical protein
MIVVGLVAGAVLTAPVAQAESCAAHLAKHGVTKAQDIAEHASGAARGESPCKYDVVDNSSDGSYTDKRRSKWDDKSSFDCGWSLRGGFGC